MPAKKSKKKRKIVLSLKRPAAEQEGLRLLYGRRIELDKTPALRIEHIGRSADGLVLSCSDYHPVYTAAGPLGHLKVRVSDKTKNEAPSVLFEEDVEYAGSLYIPLQFPRSGDWTLEVKVSDHMTGLSAVKEYRYNHIAAYPPQPAVASGEMSPELAALLEKSAVYCERLKKAALRFYCLETVNEKVATSSRTSHRKKWLYDYQIVLQRGKLEEMRSKVNSKEKKAEKTARAELETLYKSFYSFYLPVTFLSANNQPVYNYSLIDRQDLEKRSTRHILASPKYSKAGLPGGELWVDEEDGSVLQIRLDPETVSGFRERFELAKKRRKTAAITDTHQYFKLFKAMRFPTSTFILEQQSYNNVPTAVYGAIAAYFDPIVYTVHYQYDDYRFFDVQADEQVTGWLEGD